MEGNSAQTSRETAKKHFELCQGGSLALNSVLTVPGSLAFRFAISVKIQIDSLLDEVQDNQLETGLVRKLMSWEVENLVCQSPLL